jgi:hypothetical protein
MSAFYKLPGLGISVITAQHGLRLGWVGRKPAKAAVRYQSPPDTIALRTSCTLRAVESRHWLLLHLGQEIEASADCG